MGNGYDCSDVSASPGRFHHEQSPRRCEYASSRDWSQGVFVQLFRRSWVAFCRFPVLRPRDPAYISNPRRVAGRYVRAANPAVNRSGTFPTNNRTAIGPHAQFRDPRRTLISSPPFWGTKTRPVRCARGPLEGIAVAAWRWLGREGYCPTVGRLWGSRRHGSERGPQQPSNEKHSQSLRPFDPGQTGWIS